MRRDWWRTLPVLLLTTVTVAPLVEAAQERLTAVILRGASSRPGSAPSGAASPLVPGVRVESPARMWTELAFSDGSSIVLEPRADFTLQGFGKDPRTGHLVIRGSSGRGRLRVVTSGNVDIVIQTGGAEVEVVAATAVILAGADGTAILISGKSVEVRRGDRDDVLRRPGYAIRFADGSVQRLSPEQLAAALDPFGPVPVGGGPVNAVLVAEAGASTAPATAGSLSYLNPNNNFGFSVSSQLGGNGGNTGEEPPPPPTPPPPPPRQPVSWTLAANNLTYGPSKGSTIAAPAANSLSSTLDGNGNLRIFTSEGNPNTTGVTNVDFTPLGTARVRRFAPDASGNTDPRHDTGGVSVSNVGSGVANNFFQNLATGPLASAGTTTFYDALAKVGTLVLTASTGRPNDSTTSKPPPNTGSAGFDQITIPRISITDTAPVVSDPLENKQRPYLSFDPTPENPDNHSQFVKNYFGSAVFENDLQDNTPTDGKVTRLKGEDGLITFLAAPGNPYSFPSSQSSADQSVNVSVCGKQDCPFGTYHTITGKPVQAGVFIVDKIHTTAATGDNADPRGIAIGERYFVIGGTPLSPTDTGQLPGTKSGTVTRFAVSDGVNPTNIDKPGGFASGQTIDQQFMAPGSKAQPVAFNQYNAFRPEETFVPGTDRGDTHLLVVSDQSARNPAMRADLQIASNGTSSASVSVGVSERSPTPKAIRH